MLIRLPSVHRKAVPKLMGMLHHGADIELFLGWVDLQSEPGNFEHHIEILHGRRGTEAALVRDITLFGGPGMGVSFFQTARRQGYSCRVNRHTGRGLLGHDLYSCARSPIRHQIVQL